MSIPDPPNYWFEWGIVILTGFMLQVLTFSTWKKNWKQEVAVTLISLTLFSVLCFPLIQILVYPPYWPPQPHLEPPLHWYK